MVWLCVLAGVLNLVMLGIALNLEEQPTVTPAEAKKSGSTSRVACAGHVADAVPLLVRLRGDHQLRGDVRMSGDRRRRYLPDARWRSVVLCTRPSPVIWRSDWLQAGVRTPAWS
jgi:hypothetical protein